MFDNFGTAIVQAVGFFGVFGFFVYQLLSDVKKPRRPKFNSTKKKIIEPKNSNEIKKKTLFGRKIETLKKEVKPKKKGLFSKKAENIKDVEKPKKKGWFK